MTRIVVLSLATEYVMIYSTLKNTILIEVIAAQLHAMVQTAGL